MSSKSRISEGSVNDAIGQLLRTKNVRWKKCIETEKTGVISGKAGKRPDIIVNHPGSLPVVIESEFEPARTVEVDARSRLGKSLSADGREIEQAIALKLPSSIAQSNQGDLQQTLEHSVFEYAVLRRTEDMFEIRWPKKGWIEGRFDDFINFLEQTALSESIMARGMALLEECISQAAFIVERDKLTSDITHQRIANLLFQKEGEQTTRMAMAIMANAVSFHNTISNIHKIKPLSDLCDPFGNYSAHRFVKEWDYILREINYWPIFKIASDILSSLRTSIAGEVVDRLVSAAIDLERIGATSQHDLSGRMLQRLIADRKFLATFYTLPSSAALLAELAVSRLDVDWSNAKKITGLQIADFACGTGALLNATYSSVRARYRRSGGVDRNLHAPLIEKTFVGTDIMPAATHLTASILSSAHPSESFLNTRIITLPYGKNESEAGESIDIGALELIKEEEVFSLFKTNQERVVGRTDGDTNQVSLPHNSFDLVIMNPPFTHTNRREGVTSGTPIPAFGGFSTSTEEQYLMAERLKTIGDPRKASGGNAGLASKFLDVAEAKVKPGGIVALIVPFTFVSSSAWEKTRDLFEKLYQDIMVVSIANASRNGSAFSADTSIGEVLLIAKRTMTDNTTTPTVKYINLTNRPSSIVEASETARAIINIGLEEDIGLIKMGGDIQIGQYIRSKSGFEGFAGIKDMDVARASYAMRRGEIVLPRYGKTIENKLVELGQLGVRGVGSQDIKDSTVYNGRHSRGPFKLEQVESGQLATYPILWAHNHTKETKLVVDTDRQLIPRQGQEVRAQNLWDNFAGRLCLNQDFRLTSQPLAACFTPKKALGGSAWPGFKCYNQSHEVTVLLFANTTLGLIAHWWTGSRQQKGRSRVTLQTAAEIVTIDPRQFTSKQFAIVDDIFDRFKAQDFLPANEAYRDTVRQKLDEAVFIELLGLDRKILESLDILRYKWCSEPSVHGGKSTRPT